ncbi:MAG: hypothetical protein IKU26_03625 [Clostridia bacterium]|nr:hypothetical protein [Clostridia bacterium]
MEGLEFLQEYNILFDLDPSGSISDIRWNQVFLEVIAYAGDVANETKFTVIFILSVSIISLFLSKWKMSSLLLVGICGLPLLKDFVALVSVSRTGIAELTSVMVTAIPALFSLSFTGGTGLFLLVTQLLGVLILYVFLPLLLCQTALGISEGISGPFSLNGLKQSVRSLFSWGLGIVMLIFTIVSAIGGTVLGANATTVGRSLRYAGSMIPVVGRYLAESAEMIYAGSSVLAGAGGVGVCIAVIGCLLKPFIHLFIYSLIYKMTAFCIRPFGEKSVVTLLEAVSEGAGGLAGLNILTAAIALINVAVIVRIVGMAV